MAFELAEHGTKGVKKKKYIYILIYKIISCSEIYTYIYMYIYILKQFRDLFLYSLKIELMMEKIREGKL